MLFFFPCQRQRQSVIDFNCECYCENYCKLHFFEIPFLQRGIFCMEFGVVYVIYKSRVSGSLINLNIS